MYTIHDLPYTERPRERLAKFGPSALSSIELLALILGNGTRAEPVLLLAQKIISTFGALDKIADASLEDLQSIKGLGLAKAAQLSACFEIARRLQISSSIPTEEKIVVRSAQTIFQILQPKIGNFTKEHFIVVCCDTRGAINSIDTISIGILNVSVIHAREVFDVAIRRHAASIILVHNHPSGNPDPSDADITVTRRIYEAGEIFGIKVIDHIIIAQKSYASLRELRLFPQKQSSFP